MKNNIESQLGIFFVLAVIAALVILESLGTFAFFGRGYHLHASFKNVQELKIGDLVKMGGVPVGKVESITLTNTVADVRMILKNKARDQGWVKTDSKAIVKFAGLLGQNYISLDFGSPGGVAAEEGATLQAIEQPDLSSLMGKLDDVATGVQNLTRSFSGEQIDKLLGPLTDLVKNNQSNLTATIGNIRTVSDRIAQGQGTVGKLINEDTLYVTALTTVSNFEGTTAKINGAADDAHTLITNANDVIAQVNAGQGTIGKLVKDDSLYFETTGSMTNLHQILQKINDGQGTVGKLINDDSMLKNLKLSLQKLDKATESLEDTGPLSVMGTMVSSLF